MGNKYKKGFSLMELLAVIVILAILALITIPLIGNLIRQARIKSAVVSAYGYVEATNNEIISKDTKGEKVEETTYSITDYLVDNNALNIKYEGKGPSNGWFTISREKVTEGEYCINGFDIKYEDGKAYYVKDGEICPSIKDPILEDDFRSLCQVEEQDQTYGYYITTMRNKTYNIKTVDDLVCMSQISNTYNTLFETKILFINDLDMQDRKTYADNGKNKYGDINEDGKEDDLFTEMTTGKGFKGLKVNGGMGYEIDGGWHVVNHLYINRPEENYVGFIYTNNNNGKFKNIRFENANITGGNYTGLISYSYGTALTAISVTDSTIVGKNYTGGIIGSASYYDYNNPVNELYFTGSVTGDTLVGGFYGQGYIYFKGVVVDADVTGVDRVGGLHGDSGPSMYGFKSNKGAYIGGSVTATNGSASLTTPIESAYFSMLYYDNSLDVTGNTVVTNNGAYNPNYGLLSVLDEVVDTFIGGDNDGTGYYYDYDENGNFVLMKVRDDYTSTIKGEGTLAKPYLLKTEKDFKDASLKLNGDYYFKIDSDIDISTFNYFYPLGTASNYFAGHIDGNNKTISKLDLNCGIMCGLTGYVNSGEIHDLNIDNSNINVLIDIELDNIGIGTLVGYASNADINNIHVSNTNISNLQKLRSGSSRYAYSIVGGVVGTLYNGSANNIYNNNLKLNLSVGNSIGGIIGKTYRSAVTDNYNFTQLHINDSELILTLAEEMNSSVSGSYRYSSTSVGGLIGNMTNIKMYESFLDNVKVKGKNASGGVAYIFNSTIEVAFIENIDVTGGDTGSATAIMGYTGYGKNNVIIADEVVTSGIVKNSSSSSSNGVIGTGYGTSIIADISANSPSFRFNEGSATNNKAYYRSGHIISDYGSFNNDLVYYSNDIVGEYSYSSDIPNYSLNEKENEIQLLDDVLDTWIGGDNNNSGYYFDYDDNNNIVLVKTTDHPFTFSMRGSGTQSDPYLLSTENDFKSANLRLNGNYYFKIADNIDFSTFDHFYGLGTFENPFNGYLDGNNKKLSNLLFNTGIYGGFVGWLNGGNINNLTLENFNMGSVRKQNGGAGVLVGNASNSSITNINVKDISNNKMNKLNDAAGVVIGMNSGTVTYIFGDGLTSTSTVAGLVGQNTGTITTAILKNVDIYSGDGLVSSNSGTIEEIELSVKISNGGNGIGNNSSTGQILGVIADVEYKNDISSGRFAGENSGTYKAVIRSGKMKLTSTYFESYGESTENVYYSSDIQLICNNEISRLDDKIHNSVYKSNYHFINLYDDVLDTWIGGDNNNTGYYFDFENDNSNKVILKKISDAPLTFSMSGTGTASDPYILSTEQDFKMANLKLNEGKYFKFANNIDPSTFKHFYGFGSISNYFNGHIIGNDKTISNLNMNLGQYGGVFSYLNGGTVENINIDDANFIVSYAFSSGSVGGLVGYAAANSEISNISLSDINYRTNFAGLIGGAIGTNKGQVSNLEIDNLHLKNNLFNTDSYISYSFPSIGGAIGKSEGPVNDISVNNLEIKHSSRCGGAIATSTSTATNLSVYTGDLLCSSSSGGVIGDSSGAVSNLVADSITFNPITYGYVGYIGGVIGKSGTASNLYASNIDITGTYEYLGGIVGYTSTTLNQLHISNSKIKTTSYYGDNVGGVVGSTSADLSNITAENLEVLGNSYVGGIVGSGSASNVTIKNSTVQGNSNVGGVTGYQLYNPSSFITANVNVTGTNCVGGIIGYTDRDVVGVNYKGTVSGTSKVGGIFGCFSGKNSNNSSTVQEATVRGNISATGNYVGGVVGYQNNSYAAYVKYILVDANVTGTSEVGGIIGHTTNNLSSASIIDGGTITATNGQASLIAGNDTTASYIYAAEQVSVVADNVIENSAQTSFDNSYYNDLNHHAALPYSDTGTTHTIESPTTGDINNTGFIFDYGSDGKIIVVRVGETSTETTPTLQETVNQNQVCATGDTELPTCVFHYSVPVVKGIKASFSCSDNSGAPIMASMFNATTKANYSYDDILSPGRGSSKTGTVSGNTRTWTGSWTQNSEGNKPQKGLCYYYQFAAKDACGNTQSYVTSDCYYGFSGE